MKKVLIIVNQFPPFGGGGVMRALKFVKYLPSFDWQPIVVSRDFSKDLVFKDEKLLEEITDIVKLHRFESYEPIRLQKNLKRLKNNNNGNGKKNINHYIFQLLKKTRDKTFEFFLIPDKDILWVLRSAKRVTEILKKENINVIFTSSPPNSTHLLGYYLKKKNPDLKWVADFRDVWTVDGFKAEQSFILHRKLYKYIERKILNMADKVLVVGDLIKDKTIMYFGERYSSKISVIPNGFDEFDFKTLNHKQTDGCFNLTYAGSMLGYRENQKLMEGLKLLNGEIKNIRLNLLGAISDNFIKKVEDFKLKNIVCYTDFCSHKEALSSLHESDVSLFIQTNIKEDSQIPTGKLFELLRLGKPVFALAPKGVVRDIIKNFNAGIVVDPDNPEDIYNGLKDIYYNYEKYANAVKKDSEFLVKHERKELTRQLSKIFNSF